MVSSTRYALRTMGIFSNLLRPFFVGPRIASALRARPTSASRAIARGEGTEVRIVGRIHPSSATFPAPFTGEPCVFWFVCFEHETDTGMNRSTGQIDRYWEIRVRNASREPLVVIEDEGESSVQVDLRSPPEAFASGKGLDEHDDATLTEGGARRDALVRAPFLLDLPTEDVTARALANPSLEAFLQPGRGAPSMFPMSPGGPHRARYSEARLALNERIAVFGAVSGALRGVESAYRSGSRGLRISGTPDRPLVLLRP